MVIPVNINFQFHFSFALVVISIMNNSSQSISGSQDGCRITTLSTVRITAYWIIFTLGIVGNTFVLVALKRKRRRTANDWFILNLTISDLLFIVCLTSDIYVELASSPYNTFFCQVLRPLSTVIFSASIFTMTTMALERHHVITKPFHPKMDAGRARHVIGGIWVLSVFSAVPLPIVTTTGINECDESGWPAPIYSKIYTVALVVIQYLLPLAIITGAYIRIVVYLWKEKASQRRLNIRSESASRAARKENIQALKGVLTVVIFFAVCILPNQLAWLLWEFGPTTHQEIAKQLLKFSPITGYLQSCANPIIYGTFMAYFRQEFKALLMKCSLCGCQAQCGWRGTRNIHCLDHNPTSDREEPQQQCNYDGNGNGVIRKQIPMHRGKAVSEEATHKSNFQSKAEEHINPGFRGEEESEVQETRF